MLFNASKTQFLHLSTRQNLPDNYPFYFDDTHLSLSSTLNILGLSFTKTLNWESHISSLIESASKKLGVLCPQVFLLLPVADSAPLYGVRISSQKLFVLLTPLLLLTDFNLTSCTLPHNVASLDIFYRYFHALLKLLTASPLTLPPAASLHTIFY